MICSADMGRTVTLSCELGWSILKRFAPWAPSPPLPPPDAPLPPPDAPPSRRVSSEGERVRQTTCARACVCVELRDM